MEDLFGKLPNTIIYQCLHYIKEDVDLIIMEFGCFKNRWMAFSIQTIQPDSFANRLCLSTQPPCQQGGLLLCRQDRRRLQRLLYKFETTIIPTIPKRCLFGDSTHCTSYDEDGDEFQQYIPNLPTEIKHVKAINHCTKDLDWSSLYWLESLHLVGMFDIKTVLPGHIKKLVTACLPQELVELPDSLVDLVVSDPLGLLNTCQNNILAIGYIPESVQHLTLIFNALGIDEMDDGIIPSSNLKELTIANYKHVIIANNGLSSSSSFPSLLRLDAPVHCVGRKGLPPKLEQLYLHLNDQNPNPLQFTYQSSTLQHISFSNYPSSWPLFGSTTPPPDSLTSLEFQTTNAYVLLDVSCLFSTKTIPPLLSTITFTKQTPKNTLVRDTSSGFTIVLDDTLIQSKVETINAITLQFKIKRLDNHQVLVIETSRLYGGIIDFKDRSKVYHIHCHDDSEIPNLREIKTTS
ncbi:hypothetical protein DFA_07484 [Cavenderia fasciculata]|uniref:Uncharacterized protein n=1 Tax=Cavenderia fasciculata TaxID=261658 RepID=F4PWJ6_CACFS|nr:uncharacterized protein DFA_07484 [Cavenderia fasciculata]EGG20360.1 hypothetical protein DFA_07484 [Cavenderia fasciculata]|eukprot:XP_004367343.1 hypothetical protein DFA_07484 [Cavenderia fasciculata]